MKLFQNQPFPSIKNNNSTPEAQNSNLSNTTHL